MVFSGVLILKNGSSNMPILGSSFSLSEDALRVLLTDSHSSFVVLELEGWFRLGSRDASEGPSKRRGCFMNCCYCSSRGRVSMKCQVRLGADSAKLVAGVGWVGVQLRSEGGCRRRLVMQA